MRLTELDTVIRKALGVQPGTAENLARIFNGLRVTNPEAHAAWVQYDLEARAAGQHELHHAFAGMNVIDQAATLDALEEDARDQSWTDGFDARTEQEALENLAADRAAGRR